MINFHAFKRTWPAIRRANRFLPLFFPIEFELLPVRLSKHRSLVSKKRRSLRVSNPVRQFRAIWRAWSQLRKSAVEATEMVRAPQRTWWQRFKAGNFNSENDDRSKKFDDGESEARWNFDPKRRIGGKIVPDSCNKVLNLEKGVGEENNLFAHLIQIFPHLL